MHSYSEDTSEDSLNEIEVAASSASSMTPIKAAYNAQTRPSPSPSPLKQKVKSSQEAIRMRCSTLWNEKSSTPSNVKHVEKSLDSTTHGRGGDKNQAKKNNAKAQKGGKVLLVKLAKNPTIQVRHVISYILYGACFVTYTLLMLNYATASAFRAAKTTTTSLY